MGAKTRGVAALTHGVASKAINGVSAMDGAGKAMMGGCSVGVMRGERAWFEGRDGCGSSNGRGCTTGMDGATDLGSVLAALWTRDGGCTGTAWKDQHTKAVAPCNSGWQLLQRAWHRQARWQGACHVDL